MSPESTSSTRPARWLECRRGFKRGCLVGGLLAVLSALDLAVLHSAAHDRYAAPDLNPGGILRLLVFLLLCGVTGGAIVLLRREKSAALAFIERRLILLSCAAVLLACSCVDWLRTRRIIDPERSGIFVINTRVRSGMKAGAFVYEQSTERSSIFTPEDETRGALHFPALSAPLRMQIRTIWLKPSNRQDYAISFPVWLLLTAILGVLVIRELRWRERRLKQAEAAGLAVS